MKTTEFLKENSIIAQEADVMHKDHEVQMARSQMYSAAQSAIEIHRLLKDISELEGLDGWVASKLTLASEYLETVRDYLKYEAVSAESEMMEFAYESADYAFDALLEGDRTMSRAAKGNEKYGKDGMKALAKAGREGASEKELDAIRDKHDKYDEDLSEEAQKGLYYNVNKRKKAGTSRDKDHPKAPTAQAWKDAAKTAKKESVSENETGEERDAAARRENERYDNARNYQGRNSRGDVIRSGGEVVKGNPNPPSLFQRAAGALGLPNTATDALGDPMYKSSRSKAGGGGMPGTSDHDPRLGADLDPKSLMQRNTMKENASAGASSAGAVATSMSGPAHKPTSGVPKKLGNAHKPKKVTLGKGVY
jgi:hypothetical protein